MILRLSIKQIISKGTTKVKKMTVYVVYFSITTAGYRPRRLCVSQPVSKAMTVAKQPFPPVSIIFFYCLETSMAIAICAV